MAEEFPSVEALERLADHMNTHEDDFAKLGVVDCRMGVRVESTDREYTVVFERYGCSDVAPGTADIDFALEAGVETWQEMYDDIVANGHASRTQTLNYLALPGFNMRVTAEDQLGEDLFSRYGQTLQAFFDGAGAALARSVS
jgi:hypothetical protein